MNKRLLYSHLPDKQGGTAENSLLYSHLPDKQGGTAENSFVPDWTEDFFDTLP